MKTPSGMKMVRVTVPIKDFVVDMAKIEDAARRKVKGDMVNFDFVGDIKMESVKEGGPGSGPQLGDKRGKYKTGHQKRLLLFWPSIGSFFLRDSEHSPLAQPCQKIQEPGGKIRLALRMQEFLYPCILSWQSV